MNNERNDLHPDDSGIEELLQKVGVRDEPSAEAAREVEAAVHAEWRAMLAERRRRHSVAWGVAATVLLAILATLGVFNMGRDPVQVASVVRIEGRLLHEVERDTWSMHDVGRPVNAGETLRTDGRSRAALAVLDSVSVRLDRDTTLRFAAADRIVLMSGALYVDALPGARGEIDLTVQTPVGSVRHVGTQYQVRMHADGAEVSVREGRVSIRNDAGISTAVAGERIRVTAQGQVTRAPISPYDPQWQWVTQSGPRFDINDQTLAAFLSWVARETGQRLVYASPEAEAAARAVRLRGSIEGLDLETALATVLSTTRLHRYKAEPDAINIALAVPSDPR